MPSLILTGTLAFAGFSAAALSSTSPSHADQGSQTITSITGDVYARYCGPDPDGDGHLRCSVPPSQMGAFANGYCRPDQDGNGNQICYIDPSGQ